MAIEQFVPFHPLWSDFVAHLQRMNMAYWVLENDTRSKPAHYFLGSVVDDQIAGHIAIKMQIITIPANAGDESHPLGYPLCAPDGRPLRETFVQTFAVEPAFRRQGHGRALQLAALEMTEKLGCYQMRSWSSLDKQANYALKVSLGFAAHPAILVLDDGREISGVYFNKCVCAFTTK